MPKSWYENLLTPDKEREDQFLTLPTRYSSDDELSEEERKQLRVSDDPSQTRETIWSKKPVFDRLQRWWQTRLHGDKATGE